jgi:hypothetical protein
MNNAFNATDKVKDDGKIELSKQQSDPYLARPEDFKIHNGNKPLDAPFHGQSEDSPEAAKRSKTKLNRGSQHAEGNVNDVTPSPFAKYFGRSKSNG